MALPTLEKQKAWLSEKLGREVTVSQVTVGGTRHYMADYVNHHAPAMKLVSDTEEGAITNLFTYLLMAEAIRDELNNSIVGTTKE